MHTKGKLDFKRTLQINSTFMKKYRLVSVLLICSFVLMSCNRVSNVFKDENPRENYVKAIQKSPFAQNDIVQQWLAESDSVLRNPVDVGLPFQSKVVYFSDEAHAWASLIYQKGELFAPM